MAASICCFLSFYRRRPFTSLRAASMIVMPRWHSGLLDDILRIGELVRDFVPAFQGASFIV